ncbi:bidirectional sugar transporter SWEET1-like [Silene latifolia]|uniref:bidirectional sugar transporter SWEET1-like n=1 Tax=Silene latifolia TaxID=37657 RepID=UPI003D77EE96
MNAQSIFGAFGDFSHFYQLLIIGFFVFTISFKVLIFLCKFLLCFLVFVVVNCWRSLCRFILFLAPFATFKRIVQNKSTEQFSGMVYVATLFNNLLSAWYGFPFVSEDNSLVLIINGVGALIETAYVVIFLIFAPKKEKLTIVGVLAIVLVIFGGVAFHSLHAYPDNEIEKRTYFCGIIACISSSIMYIASLPDMLKAYQTGSMEYMPFLLSLFCFLCGTSWFIFGLLGRDLFLVVSNGIGCVVGASQLIMHSIYYYKNAGTSSPTTEALLARDSEPDIS